MGKIPKILHAGAFGQWKPTELNQQCFASWNRVLPDYERRWWTEVELNKNWVREAAAKCPVNAHNYMLMWSVWKHGGVAMDNDVEVLRPLDLDHGAFVGFQKDRELRDSVNNCVVGAVASHPLIRRIIHRMEQLPPGSDPIWLGPGLLTDELTRIGMTQPGVERKIGDVMIYGRERFSPFFHDEPKNLARVTERTFAVHWYQGSWAKKTP